MNKQIISGTLLCSVCLCALFAWAQPAWIQYSEYAVGENEPTGKPDVVNRPAKYIWQQFEVEHNVDGTHKTSLWGFVSQADFDTYVSTAQAEINDAGYTATQAADSVATVSSVVTAMQTTLSTTQSDVNALETRIAVEHNTDGTHNIVIPPTGGSWGLVSTAHGNAAVSFARSLLALSSGDMQLVAMAKPATYGVAEQFVSLKNDAYSCNRFAFGKDTTNHLFLILGTDLYDENVPAILCTEQTYLSSFALTDDAKWHEYAVQINTAGNVTFYLDGAPGTGTPMTGGMDLTDYASETWSFGEGFAGTLASVKIGSRLTWNPSAYKGISQEGAFFPGGVALLPLNEGEGATAKELLSGSEMTIDGGWTWAQVPGPF